ncbi:MAG TPA: carboxypeptidase regulatory-like domain-containing protein, partial [Gemmatimonadaceae bacterium]|nr:carboxypeptidase regulatory-like domain-containing protein [Gemmatimonadaceae bacterium]
IAHLAACGALMGAFPALLAAQTPGTGVVAGRVMTGSDTGLATPARGATVLIVGTALRAMTDTDGRFLLGGVPAGPAILRVLLLGYRAADRAIELLPGDTARVELILQPEARVLSPVRVEASLSRPDVATIAVDAAAMSSIPTVGEPDVVRVAQLLPGVVARNDFNTGLNVRGGEADQNLILLDGHPIHNPFHLGGLFSTFMDATVGGIELTTGAFPARYGGRLSSVLDVRSADDARPGMHGSADLSALAATGRLAGSLGGERGTWSVAARRTYADAVTSIFTTQVFPYHFRDFHGRATYALPGNVRVAVTAYAGKDVLDANLAELRSDSAPSRASEGRWAVDWGNRVIGFTIAKDLGENATIEQRISHSHFATQLDLGDGTFGQRSRIGDGRLAGSLLVRGATHDRTIGYELATHRIRYSSGSAQTATTEFDIVQRPTTAAVWIDDLWRASPRWLVEGGLRAEALSGREWAALSPRLSVKYFATPSLAFSAAGGRVTQWLHSLAGDGALRFFDVWLASDSFTPVATAWHWVAGAEYRVRDAGSVRLEGYVKRFDRVMEADWSEDPNRRGDEFFEAKGMSYGMDLHARWRSTRGAAGWVTYSYGVSSRWRDGMRWTPGHDRRHDVDVVGSWRLAKYRLGVRVGYATGTPYTPIVGEIARRMYDPSRDRWGTGNPDIQGEALGGARNAARFPPTHRLDLDVSREFQVRGATLTPYVSVVNAYNAKNVFIYLYDYSTDQPTRRSISQFPILPSVGARVAF